MRALIIGLGLPLVIAMSACVNNQSQPTTHANQTSRRGEGSDGETTANSVPESRIPGHTGSPAYDAGPRAAAAQTSPAR